ncbi:MAG: 50S ribosomal protein L10 [Parcubacteria group bacterium GW2011_GWB1_38_8]|uniref:Large ribosomal subunit protein uL10 n=1 Tax=Candidatus Zambryskibacteria bacterium RIFCSPLOWO2_02_FULL_39_14 TaxID=1802769 RepID=A0A1G2UIW5_9BACT|nr:MAG: 50S ribosomal protein L10 [Parcubacteria group bacterium GW2011_GWB1_38_8]KKR30904.1 MAG: 50S ribosomal protein L10 [Parcubacteria group bacterium GW2011_GWC1_39_8]OHA94758.1 MAG: 50S ribosomal protein L10 [Candidatus Zambryskibacteria bacterium RIFCSPHIGHO2_02_FULL_39_16]OHB09353.1 MAG: 50S ribosomal protein L10 [Candidatus Zambryskibacteria bacterium RIFCSPLOWO2_02_FULL_39_14]
MAINRAKKEEIVNKLKKTFKDAKSLVFVNFRGLGVVKATEMRRALKGESISYMVAKKTLTNRVLDIQKITGTKPELEGELALAWGEDLVAPAREVYAFQKKFPESLKILGGIFDGKYMDKLAMEEIALIPGLDVLRGKFVNIINSPIQRVAVALGEIAKLKN